MIFTIYYEISYNIAESKKKFVEMKRLSVKDLIYLYNFLTGRGFILFETK